jgi:hypothetical protein
MTPNNLIMEVQQCYPRETSIKKIKQIDLTRENTASPTTLPPSSMTTTHDPESVVHGLYTNNLKSRVLSKLSKQFLWTNIYANRITGSVVPIQMYKFTY